MPIDGGRAVVDVEAKADESSLKRVAKQIEQALSKTGDKAGNRFARQFDISLGRGAVLFGTFNSLASPAASAISELSGGVVALGASIQQTTIASSAFAGVLGSVIQSVKVAGLAFTGFDDALTAASPKKVSEALAKMSPAARATATALIGLKKEWLSLTQAVQQAVFKGVADDIQALADTYLPILQARFVETGGILNGLFTEFAQFAQTEGFVTRFNTALSQNNTIFKTLSEAAIPFLDGLLNLFIAIQPAANRLAGSIGALAERFQEWTQQAGFAERIDGILRRAQNSAGLLLGLVGKLGAALGNVFTAAAPAGDRFVTMLSNALDRFNAFAESASGQSAIAQWAQNGVDAMARLGELLNELGPVFATLADPAVFNGIVNVFIEWAKAMQLLAPLLTTTAKALGAFAPVLGPLLALSGVFFAFRLQASIFSGAVGNAVKGMRGLYDGAKTTAVVLGNVRNGFVSASAASSAFSGVAGTIGGKLRQVVDFTVALGGSLARLVTGSRVFAILATGIRAVGTALAALAFNPVFLTIAAIVALGAALVIAYKKSETFRNIVNAAFSGIASVATAAWNGIVTGFNTVISGLTTGWESIKTAAMAVFDFLAPYITGIFAVLTLPIRIFFKTIEIAFTVLQIAALVAWNAIKAAALVVFEALKAYFTTWFAVLQGLFTIAVAALMFVWDGIKAAAIAVFEFLKPYIMAALDAIVAFFAPFIEGIKAAFAQVVAFVTPVWETIKSAAITAFNFVSNAVTTFVGTVTDVFTTVKDFLGRVWDGLVSGAQAALGKVKGFLNGIIDGINTVIRGVNSVGAIVGAHHINEIGKLAHGTMNWQGGPAIVGEQGPELLNLPKGSQVTPARQTAKALGQTIINNNYYGPTTDSGRKQMAEWYQRFAPRYPTTQTG